MNLNDELDEIYMLKQQKKRIEEENKMEELRKEKELADIEKKTKGILFSEKSRRMGNLFFR